MSTHKLLTPWPTNQSKRARGSKHVAVYIRSLMGYHIHITGRPCFCIARTHCTKSFSAASPSTGREPGIFSATFSLLFSHFRAIIWRGMPYSWNSFRLWNLSCLNLCDGFVNVTGRVIIPPHIHGRRGHHLEKWPTQRARTMEHGTYFLAVIVP